MPDDFEIAIWMTGDYLLAINMYMNRTKCKNVGECLTAFQMVGFASRGVFEQTPRNHLSA